MEASLVMLLSLLFSFSVDPIRQDKRRNEMDYGPRNVLTNALMAIAPVKCPRQINSGTRKGFVLLAYYGMDYTSESNEGQNSRESIPTNLRLRHR